MCKGADLNLLLQGGPPYSVFRFRKTSLLQALTVSAIKLVLTTYLVSDRPAKLGS
jgi:hypothetical protein